MHDFARAMGDLAKTDSPDARGLSQFVRTLNSSERCDQLLLRLPDVQQQELATLTRQRAQLVQIHVAECNRLRLAHLVQAVL